MFIHTHMHIKNLPIFFLYKKSWNFSLITDNRQIINYKYIQRRLESLLWANRKLQVLIPFSDDLHWATGRASSLESTGFTKPKRSVLEHQPNTELIMKKNLAPCGTDGRLLLSGFNYSWPWPWPWPWTGSYGIRLCISHQPLAIYQISLKSEKLCRGQTKRREHWKFKATWHKN